MIFNSWTFGVFFFMVYLLYLKLEHRQQNVLLLIASWVFYGFWDYRFLLLLWISTVVDYSVGMGLNRTTDSRARRALIMVSIAVNLGLLGFFKYYDFFINSTADLLSFFGFKTSLHTLGIIVPVGISFYTFQTLGYALSVYRGEIKACQRFLDFSLFVSFFPQLVAGPIERAKHLLVQVQTKRVLAWDNIKSGLWLILKGYFLKVFVADNLTKMVDPVFSAADPQGAQVLMAVYAFAFQIYGDFAGYSNIARGISRLMGFDLMVNFRAPYFAVNPRDFWQRWHISLSTWLRDYLYISLGGNRHGEKRTYANLMVTMFLGGLWHGANWTYVIWGVFHGSMLVIHRVFSKFTGNFKLGMPKIIRVILYFHLTCLGWFIFRSKSIGQFIHFFSQIFSSFKWDLDMTHQLAVFLFLVIPVVCLDIVEEYDAGPNCFCRWQPIFRYAVYMGMFALIYVLGSRGGTPFIYFQF